MSSAMKHTSLLASWHADPLSTDEAGLLAHSSEARLRHHPANRHAHFIATLTQIISDWWLEQPNRETIERVFIDARTKRQLAMSHIIAGQLLISRKLTGAMEYLDMGLDYADGLLKPDDYFTIYNRHNDLRHLPLSHSGQKPHSLNILLNEARVIQLMDKDNQGWSSDDWPNHYSMP